MDSSFEQFGIASTLACESKQYGISQLNYLRNWLKPAIAHRQVHFAFDETGKPVAYWTWALLAPDAERRLIENRNALLHISEWNEGGNLWIIDFCAPHGYVIDIVSWIRREMFRGYREAYSLRRNRNENYRKISVWRMNSFEAVESNNMLYHLPDYCFADSRTTWAIQKRRAFPLS